MARALLPKLLGAVVCGLLFLVVVKFFRSAGIVLIPVSALVGFVVAYVGSVRWAKPYAIVGTPKYCEVCNRDDVGYAEPGDSVCADCKERVEYDRIMAEQRRLESKPGYVRPAAVEREIARLSKWDRRHRRPNEEL